MSAPPRGQLRPEFVLSPPHHFATTMTPDIQAPFLSLLLLFPVLTGEGHKVGRGLPCSCGLLNFLWVLLPGRWHPRGRSCRRVA